MTPQEKLHAVETAIRKILPRLTKPTEGCRILEHREPLEQYAVILAQRLEDKYLIYTPYNSDNPCEEIDQKELSENYEILGHDILLYDVLEWITLFNDFCLWQGMILKPIGASNYYAEFETINGECFDKNIIEWNLPKPRLADQSEELWNFLYNLI